MSEPLRVVVLISGSGSNLQTLIDGQQAGRLPIDIRAVVSNRADAYGLERARAAGIPTHVLSHRGYADRAHYDADLAALVDEFQPGLVVLAGFMRILTPAFVARYSGRLINIHPSLLPAYRGLRTHERVLADGCGEHGCSVHFVIPELDAGPVIVQARVPVEPNDTPESLHQKVQVQEHRAYPLAVRWIAEGRACLDNGEVRFQRVPDGRPPVIDADTDIDAL
ncbi:phosphoribosylglycinamide formyltransferase [Arhodomonas sp. AD133]|uniref:phosphoribosylglycinamide formyltransferase n=1 Tax=Arhodomonas sp. AD133 TaxID=3415009 RepID=UPI003EBA1D72